jgi:hypothetical protein
MDLENFEPPHHSSLEANTLLQSLHKVEFYARCGERGVASNSLLGEPRSRRVVTGSRLRNDDAGEAAEMGVAGDELRVTDAGGGVDDGVHCSQAVVEADGGGG